MGEMREAIRLGFESRDAAIMKDIESIPKCSFVELTSPTTLCDACYRRSPRYDVRKRTAREEEK